MKIFYLILTIALFFISCEQETNKINNTSACANSTFIDGSGNSYTTISIGNKCWFTTNLKTKKFNNGDSIHYISNDIQWQNANINGFCYYNNDSALASNYQYLYNYFTIIDPRGVCPIGSHVANDSDWIDLSNYIIGNGALLKEIGNSHWANPNIGASNTFNFSALGSGFRTYTGIFSSIGEQGRWWSLNDSTNNLAFDYYIKNNDTLLVRDFDVKSSGFSIRCVAN